MTREEQNLWPSFVDLMSSMFLFMLFITLALVFARPEEAKEDGASVELSDILARERAERIKNEANTSRIDALNQMVAEMDGTIIKKENEIKTLEQQNREYKNRVERLGRELQKLNAVFEATDKYIAWQKVQIVELGKKLNRALANKTAELHRVRSDFFGSLLGALEGNRNFEIRGDRFVLPSEVFFAPESAEIGEAGRAALDGIAATLIEAMQKIPDDTDWILRVDGHTDSRPVRAGSLFADNWELSSARAGEVVRYLHSRGIPADRLAAAGFGEFQPVAVGNDNASLSKNRRIEFKLTEK